MNYRPAAFADGQLPNTKTTLYTVPTGKYAFVKELVLVNTGASARTVNIYVNRSGVSRRISDKDKSVDVGERYVLQSTIALEGGDIIEGDASTAAEVDYVISGLVTV